MRNTAPSYAREAHERVLKRFIFEETEADEEATNHSTSLVSNSNVSTDTGRNSSSSDVGGEGATAQDALPSLQLVPLRGIAVDRCLALWHFLLGFAKPLKLRQLPHWMELHDAVHVVTGPSHWRSRRRPSSKGKDFSSEPSSSSSTHVNGCGDIVAERNSRCAHHVCSRRPPAKPLAFDGTR